jgi:hypothetical protein
MDELWTIVFVAALAVGFAVAAWHDRDKARRRERQEAACGKASERRD